MNSHDEEDLLKTPPGEESNSNFEEKTTKVPDAPSTIVEGQDSGILPTGAKVPGEGDAENQSSNNKKEEEKSASNNPSKNEKEKEGDSKGPPRDKKSPEDRFPKKGKKRNTDGEKSGTKKQPKELFSFEDLVKAMHSGDVQTLMNSYELPGIPHRGIMVKNICVPIVALLSDKEIRKGKIVNREIVDLPTGRRHVANVGRIKTYESNVHDKIVTTLTSRTWEMVEFHAFTEGQQPLFKNGNTKVLTINLKSSCTNIKFLACKTVEFLWWNSPMQEEARCAIFQH